MSMGKESALNLELQAVSRKLLPASAGDFAVCALQHIHEGRFQRSLSLMVAATSVASGLEVAYEHYKGSYSNPVMYTPVILSGVLTCAGVAGFANKRAAATFLRWTSYATFFDGLIGFLFHCRGIARKPGGWRLPLTNIVMGPPIFAPLLFGTSAYLGIMASYLRREDEDGLVAPQFGGWRGELARGEFQRHLAIVTAAWALFSGFEAWYSHYKSNFRRRSQWLPVVLTPLLMGAAIAAVFSAKAAVRALPAASLAALAIGGLGAGYHAQGIIRRPGGLKKPMYNTIYGPPIFAPLLIAACGTLGLLASLLKRERRS